MGVRNAAIIANSIQTVIGPNDYASMREVLTRRFTHGLEEQSRMKEQGAEQNFGSFTRFPDILMMDGGRGQVNIAEDVLAKLGLSIPSAAWLRMTITELAACIIKMWKFPLTGIQRAFA